MTKCPHIDRYDPSKYSLNTLHTGQLYIVFAIISFFCLSLTVFFKWLRAKYYQDKENIDIEFDAGGQVSSGLTATTLVSQWTWAATLLKSSEMCVTLGISGPFWYAAGACIQIILFSIISVQLKIRAPGAKTFLQVIRARFGSKTHIVYCIFAMMTNLIVTSMLMLGGTAVLKSLVQDQSIELSLMLICALVCSMTMIGGLGATFYVSYFTTAFMFIVILIFLVTVFHTKHDDFSSFGNLTRMYEHLSCLTGPATNKHQSYLTMISEDGLMFGIINIIGNFGTVFVDQSYWQSSVAAKPREGVWGFILGGTVWFSIPFTFATTMGFSYLILDSGFNGTILTNLQIQQGLVPPMVAKTLMGFNGELLIILIIILCVTTTASAEVMAVSSILIYDIYAIYLRPYRKTFDANTCLLCGKMRGRMATSRDKCECESMTYCQSCIENDRSRATIKRSLKPPFTCRVHGRYRSFQEYLAHLKNWCIIFTTVAIIPIVLLLDVVKVNLGWLYSFMGILIGSAIVPVSLTMIWAKLTPLAAFLSPLIGTSGALIGWLTYTALQDNGGILNFIPNSGKTRVMLVGNCLSISLGLIISIVVSLVQNRHFETEKSITVWDNTRDIDNPLSPWPENYAKELRLTGAQRLDKRPSLEDVQKAFRKESIFALVTSLVLTFILVILWPAISVSVETLDYNGFVAWVTIMHIWIICGAIYSVVAPVVNEIQDIHRIINQNKVADSMGAT